MFVVSLVLFVCCWRANISDWLRERYANMNTPCMLNVSRCRYILLFWLIFIARVNEKRFRSNSVRFFHTHLYMYIEYGGWYTVTATSTSTGKFFFPIWAKEKGVAGFVRWEYTQRKACKCKFYIHLDGTYAPIQIQLLSFLGKCCQTRFKSNRIDKNRKLDDVDAVVVFPKQHHHVINKQCAEFLASLLSTGHR